MIQQTTILFTLLFICGQTFAQFGEWISVANMPAGKHHPVTFALNGFGYAVTGSTNNSLQIRTDDFYRYDPIADEWTVLDDFPGDARSFAIGQAYNGKGYLGFGASTNEFLRDIWEFDPVSESWTLVTQCPCEGRRHPAFIIHEDKIYVGLGDGLNGNLRDWWIYDMIADSWSQQTDLPAQTRHHPFMFTAGEQVYVGFGHGDVGIFRNWFRFNVVSNQWEQQSQFPGESRVAGTQFSHNGIGYILSGDGSDHSFMPTGEFWKYDHINDSWEELTPHPGISRWAPGSFVIGDTVYFLGGENRQTGLVRNDVWKFQLVPNPGDTIPPAGVNNNFSNNFNLFPNPNNGLFQIAGLADMSIEIRNHLGQSVPFKISENSVEILKPESGVYFLMITQSNGQHSTQKIVVQ